MGMIASGSERRKLTISVFNTKTHILLAWHLAVIGGERRLLTLFCKLVYIIRHVLLYLYICFQLEREAWSQCVR